MKQAVDENCDVGSRRQIWKCESSKSVTTVAEYARYQQNMLQKEREVCLPSLTSSFPSLSLPFLLFLSSISTFAMSSVSKLSAETVGV